MWQGKQSVGCVLCVETCSLVFLHMKFKAATIYDPEKSPVLKKNSYNFHAWTLVFGCHVTV